MKKRNPAIVVAVDVGKTKVAMAAVGENGGVITKIQERSDFSNGSTGTIEQIVRLIRSVIETRIGDLEGIGVASMGVVDSTAGLIVGSGSIPQWNNVPISQILQSEFQVPVHVENDVNAAAYGEYTFGVGRGIKNLAFLTVSTGIGIGIIIDSNLWRGRHGLAGGIAHLPLFGGRTTVNEIASGSGIAARGSAILGRGITTQEVFALAKEGQKQAAEIVDSAVTALADIIVWLQNTLDPDCIVLGGAVVIGQPQVLEGVKATALSCFSKYVSRMPTGPEVLISQLGNNAELVGIAALLRQRADHAR